MKVRKRMTSIQMNMQFMRTLHIYLENTGENSRIFSKSKKYASIAILCGSSQNMRKNMRSHNRIFPGGLSTALHKTCKFVMGLRYDVVLLETC